LQDAYLVEGNSGRVDHVQPDLEFFRSNMVAEQEGNCFMGISYNASVQLLPPCLWIYYHHYLLSSYGLSYLFIYFYIHHIHHICYIYADLYVNLLYS